MLKKIASLVALAIGLTLAAPAKADYLSIVNYNSGMCLAAAFGTMQAGQPIIQWPCTGGNDQMWNISAFQIAQTTDNMSVLLRSSGNQLQLQNLKNPNFCLAVNDSNQGSQLVVQPCSAGAQTRWNITQVPITNPIFLNAEYPYFAESLTSAMTGMVAAVSGGSTAQNTGIIQWQNQIAGANTHKEQQWLFSPSSISYPMQAPFANLTDGATATLGGRVNFSINGNWSISGGEITVDDLSGRGFNFNVRCTVTGAGGDIFSGWPSWSGSIGGNIIQLPTAKLTGSGNSSVIQQSWRQILSGSVWGYLEACDPGVSYPCGGLVSCTWQ
jgi:hypothetical protein